MSENYLQNKNKITARRNFYTDIDLNITPHPSSGDLVLKQDKEAVKRSVRNIMLTNDYERPFKPNFGANLRGLLFELADDITKMEIRNQISEALEMLEPRVRIDEIYLTQTRPNEMNVNLHYGIVGSREPQEIEVILQRVR
jgi:phage baseplate assembly protein W|tara:strand:- start:193 stop:615 length:423 start_codon:yes stop_codon:yes gene_type:complete